MQQRTLEGSTEAEASSISQAIESAFDILGPVSKQKLFSRLQNDYAINICSVTTANLNEIKAAIADLFGEAAASMFMKAIYSEIDKI
jgi:hypothetical protein